MDNHALSHISVFALDAACMYIHMCVCTTVCMYVCMYACMLYVGVFVYTITSYLSHNFSVVLLLLYIAGNDDNSGVHTFKLDNKGCHEPCCCINIHWGDA